MNLPGKWVFQWRVKLICWGHHQFVAYFGLAIQLVDTNGANIFSFLSSLPLLPQPLLLAVLYLLLTYTVSWVKTCLSLWLERFRGSQKKTNGASWYIIPLWWSPSIGERNANWGNLWGNLKRHRERRWRYWMTDIAVAGHFPWPQLPHQSHISLGTDSACLRKNEHVILFYIHGSLNGLSVAVWHSCSYRKIILREGKTKCRHLKNWPINGLCGRCLSVWWLEPHTPRPYTYSHGGGVEPERKLEVQQFTYSVL